jgi:hypothetical protein
MSASVVMGAGAAAMAQAVRASGVVVRMEPAEFLRLLERQQAPLVVRAVTNLLFFTNYQYLTSYKGLAFFARSSTPLTLPPGCEIIDAGGMWMPG